MNLLAGAAVFVLPSYSEGFPNAVLEAMAQAKPIIATDVGAIPDMLDGCGMVIPPKSSQALARALEALMNSPEDAQSMGKRARLKLEREYSLERVFSLYQSIWKKKGKA